MEYYFPLVEEIKEIITNENVPKVRRDGYRIIEEMIWRSLKIFCRRPSERYNY
jgi:mRNA-degrading endonuclease RelE of RelBE toxin-antitoxin system